MTYILHIKRENEPIINCYTACFTNSYKSRQSFFCLHAVYMFSQSVDKCLRLFTKSANRTRIREHFDVKSRIGCEFGVLRVHLLEVHLARFKWSIRVGVRELVCIGSAYSINKNVQRFILAI
jgi:hypothetical protein